MLEKQRNANFQKWQTINSQKSVELWIIDTLNMDGRYRSLEDAQLSRKQLEVLYNQLQAQGLDKEKIDRVYQGLFVYSKGFNELLEQCCKQQQLKISIWKAYIILIERYNHSEYQLMLKTIVDSCYKDLEQVKVDKHSSEEKVSKLQQQIMDVKNQMEDQSFEETNLREGLQKQLLQINNQFNQTVKQYDKELERRTLLETKITQTQEQFMELNLKHQQLIWDYQYIQNQKASFTSEIQEKRDTEEASLSERRRFHEQIQQLEQKLLQEQRILKIKIELIEQQENQLQEQSRLILNLQQQLQSEKSNNRINRLNEHNPENNLNQIQALLLENEDYKNRLKQFTDQIDAYLSSRQFVLNEQIDKLQVIIKEQNSDITKLSQKVDTLAQKKRKIKLQLKNKQIDYNIVSENLKLTDTHLSDLESSSQFSKSNNQKLTQYIQKLLECIKKLEENESILNARIKSQFKQIGGLSDQIETMSRHSAGQLETLNKQLLIKAVELEDTQRALIKLQTQIRRTEQAQKQESFKLYAQNQDFREEIQRLKKDKDV